jgi:hypothetical protein
VVTLTRAQRAAVGCIAAGAVLIALIGFTGSYAAVQGLAVRKGFGWFSYALPVGVDVGIAVLLALDLVLTWLRIPFPLLRQTAWLLTAATIVFNAASAWPDPLAVAMHAIIPMLFVVVVEAGRHAVARLADISVGRHMDSVRLARWILAPLPTFRLWRRMKLWELRSYDDVVALEQNRLVYRARLRAEYGRAWRRHAPVELLLPLKLARYGVPLPVLPRTAARLLDGHTEDAQALTGGEARADVAVSGVFPAAGKVAEPPSADPEAAVWAAFAAAAMAPEAHRKASNLDEFPPVTEAEPESPDASANLAEELPAAEVETITEPLLSSESPDLGLGLPEAPAEAFLEWLDDQQPPTAEQPVLEPQAVTESPDPEPDRAQEQALKLAAGQAARLERLRQNRQAAAEAWWTQLRQGVTPVHAAHAKAFGMSAPTLHKALAEFPEPVPEVVP